MDIELYQGDCLDIMPIKIPDNHVDLTVTSPPYDNLRTYNNSLEWGEHIWKPIIQELYRITKDGGVVVWVVGDATIKGSETGTSFKQALWAMECGFNLHDTMIYDKGKISFPETNRYSNVFEYMFIFSKDKPKTFNCIKDRKNKWYNGTKEIKGHYRTEKGEIKRHNKQNLLQEYGSRFNIWTINNGCNKSTLDKIAFEHPAIFPEQLANDHIISWSNEGDTVFDCFMGSGTTGKMALLNNRNFIGIEKDDKYFEIAKNRIEQARQDAEHKLF
jgi:site-specific DNA-methyltransferase (adenine-specific)